MLSTVQNTINIHVRRQDLYSESPTGIEPMASQIPVSLSHARVIVEKFIFIILISPSLKFTIFIIYNTLDDFDIADPSSMQDVCHIST